MRFESGDQRTIGRSLFRQPALSVAYPKSFTPSVVSCVSFPLATSRTHKFQSLIYAESLPSGETTSGPPPPRRPKPVGAGAGVIPSSPGVVPLFFEPSAGFTSTYSLPVGVNARYQNRP